MALLSSSFFIYQHTLNMIGFGKLQKYFIEYKIESQKFKVEMKLTKISQTFYFSKFRFWGNSLYFYE